MNVPACERDRPYPEMHLVTASCGWELLSEVWMTVLWGDYRSGALYLSDDVKLAIRIAHKGSPSSGGYTTLEIIFVVTCNYSMVIMLSDIYIPVNHSF